MLLLQLQIQFQLLLLFLLLPSQAWLERSQDWESRSQAKTVRRPSLPQDWQPRSSAKAMRRHEAKLAVPTKSVCGGEDFCEVAARDYPEEVIRRAVEKIGKIRFSIFDSGDGVERRGKSFSWGKVHRKDEERFENSRNLCDLKHRVFLPQAGLTTDGRRTFIVNTQEYQQYVQVGECRHPGESCTNDGEETFCKQEYTAHKLAAIEVLEEEYVTTKIQEFFFPSGCSCHIVWN